MPTLPVRPDVTGLDAPPISPVSNLDDKQCKSHWLTLLLEVFAGFVDVTGRKAGLE